MNKGGKKEREVKLGLMGAPLLGGTIEEGLDIAKKVGLDCVELPIGAYPAPKDPWDLVGIAKDAGRIEALRGMFAARGLEVAGIAAHGNPVDPDSGFAKLSHDRWRAAMLLGEAFKTTVIAFSGCPAAVKGDKTPAWPRSPWPDVHSQASIEQWNDVILPYWREEAKFAADHGVNAGFEGHPNMTVYSPNDILHIRGECGNNVGANVDLSHWGWNDIDPFEAITLLGQAGAIFHFHAKDWVENPAFIRRDGHLSPQHFSEWPNRAWDFAAVGIGHGSDWWGRVCRLLRAVGYDGVASIEHEDRLYEFLESLAIAMRTLNAVMPRKAAGPCAWFAKKADAPTPPAPTA